MQVIAVGNTTQDLCDKLASVAVPRYFDSVEMQSSDVVCKVGTDVAVRFGISNGYFSITLYFSNHSTTQPALRTGYFDQIVVTTKAIVLLGSVSKEPFIIAMDTSGGLAACCHADSDGFIRNPYTANGCEIRTYHILGDGEARRSYYTNNDTTNRTSYFVPLFMNGDTFVDGVYVGLVRPYPNEPGYMPFTIGSTEYVGFGGTSLIVKA